MLDVRTPSEYNSEHINGSVNIDFLNPSFGDEISKFDKEKKYLIYCRSGARAASAQEVMNGRGFNNIFNLSGGIIEWVDQGFEVER